jgi:hypothetical protein
MVLSQVGKEVSEIVNGNKFNLWPILVIALSLFLAAWKALVKTGLMRKMMESVGLFQILKD